MLWLILLSFVAVPEFDALPAGTSWTCRGSFVAEKGDPADMEKQFEVTFLVGSPAGETLPLYWISEERGRGSWSWADRCGKWDLNTSLRPVDGTGPSLQYERPEGASVVALPSPLLTYREPLAAGTSWFEGQLEHRVAGEEPVGGVDCWRVEVASPIGRKKVLWVDKSAPIVVALSEKVFIGQGELHELRWDLTSRSVKSPEQTSALIGACDEFLRLRSRLEIEPRTRDIRWSPERLALLKADLPAFSAKAQGTLLEKLTKAIELDSKLQKDRSNALGALQNKLVGNAAPQSKLETVTGQDFSWADVGGKVVVLHFWEYRDVPLEEPYGQVAYLDFVARQHAAGDVRFFGVVSDERVTQPDTKRAGVQSAKRLQAFMNLSYPLLVDTGNAVKGYGDPRVTGAKLPLFVVIDRKGKITHYHAGLYDVHRDRGLEELSQVIQRALADRE